MTEFDASICVSHRIAQRVLVFVISAMRCESRLTIQFNRFDECLIRRRSKEAQHASRILGQERKSTCEQRLVETLLSGEYNCAMRASASASARSRHDCVRLYDSFQRRFGIASSGAAAVRERSRTVG